MLNLIETFKTISSLFKDFVLNQDPMVMHSVLDLNSFLYFIELSK